MIEATCMYQVFTCFTPISCLPEHLLYCTSAETIIRLFDYLVGMTLFNLLTHYFNSR